MERRPPLWGRDRRVRRAVRRCAANRARNELRGRERRQGGRPLARRHADTPVVSLVHEERLDIPALKRAVEGGAFYVGALGSRRAQEKRREHLGDLLDQVRGPVGLDLGGETPSEVALEILAEMLAVRKNPLDPPPPLSYSAPAP